MKDLVFYSKYAKSIMDSLNIPYVDCDIKVSYRMTRTWGYCHLDGYTHKYDITISHRLLKDEVDDDALMNTLIHEYLHTCPKCMNHGKLWKHYAEMINSKYHYHIKTRTSSAEKGIVDERKPKYVIECPHCHKQSYYYRKSSVVTAALNNRRLTCGTCGYSGNDFPVEHMLNI